MALNGIGNTKVKAILYQNYKYIELTPRESITVTREPNCPSKLTLTMRRDDFSAEEGDYIGIALDEGHNFFKGIVWEVHKKKDREEIVAYDQILAMQKSNTLFVYENMKANEVLLKAVDDLGLEIAEEPQVMDTGYVIPVRVEDNSTYLDAVLNAIDETFKNTNMRYYLWDDAGNIVLWDNEHMVIDTSFVSAKYIEEYDIAGTLDGVYNYVRVDSTAGAEAQEDGQRQSGIAQDEWSVQNVMKLSKYESVQGEENVQAKANSMLEELSKRKMDISITKMQGDVRVRGGSIIYVDFETEDKLEYVKGWFRVKSVTHKIESGFHTMDLNLELVERIFD